MTDHFTEAEARAAILDERIKSPVGAATEVVVSHGILHALLAIADQLEGLREVVETATEPAQTVQEHPYTGKDVPRRSTMPPGLDSFG